MLEKIVIEPELSSATSCVIWLHGLGDSGAGFAPVVPALNLPKNHAIRFVFPHAPEQAVTINNGQVMRSWYDIKSMDLHNRADINGVESSEKLVHELINEQLANGIAANKIILAGFSQGGVLSLFTGLRFDKPLAGIMALSCYLPNADKLPTQLNEANNSTPILQHHGKQDNVVPYGAGEVAYNLLLANGYKTQWQSYHMAHSVLPEQLADISVWISERLL